MTTNRRSFLARLGALFCAPKLAQLDDDAPALEPVPVSQHESPELLIWNHGQSQLEPFPITCTMPAMHPLTLGAWVGYDEMGYVRNIEATGSTVIIGRCIRIDVDGVGRMLATVVVDSGPPIVATVEPRHTPCPLTFKSKACGYTGAETSCDKTLAGCTARAHFGGFPL